MSYEDGKIVAEALLGALDEATCEWDVRQENIVVFPKDLRRTTKVVSLDSDKLVVCIGPKLILRRPITFDLCRPDSIKRAAEVINYCVKSRENCVKCKARKEQENG